MDLDHYGRPDLSELFVSEYIKASGDDGARDLMSFFKAYRAYVRGKVTAFRLDDDTLPDEERSSIMSTSQSYFQLAHQYALSELFPRPAIIMVVGLMGSGKTYVSEQLAQRWNIAHISTDLTRKELAGIGASEHSCDAYGQGIYSPEFSRRTYDTMYDRARHQIASGKSVVLDGTFRDRDERQRVLGLSRDQNADLWIVECVAPDDEIKLRLDRRTEGVEQTASDGRWELFQQQKADWDEINEIPSKSYIRLDTSRQPEITLESLIETLFSRSLSQSSVEQG
jgi:hypothetical protein